MRTIWTCKQQFFTPELNKIKKIDEPYYEQQQKPQLVFIDFIAFLDSTDLIFSLKIEEKQ